LQRAVVITERCFGIAFAFARNATIEVRHIQRWVEGGREGVILDGFFKLALFEPLVAAFEIRVGRFATRGLSNAVDSQAKQQSNGQQTRNSFPFFHGGRFLSTIASSPTGQTFP
jgi:hypothetical protein